jgi:hypothetical protein
MYRAPLSPADQAARKRAALEEARAKGAALEAARVPLATITAAEKTKIAQLVQARGRGEFVERELKDMADHVLYAMVMEVKAKRGETKRGMYKWRDKINGEYTLRARCLRYLCDASYVSGSEIKQERKRRRTAGGYTAQ